MEKLHASNGQQKLPLVQRAALAATILAACAGPQHTQTESPRSEPRAPKPLDPFCQKAVEKLLMALDPENANRCAEDNSRFGPRMAELRGACIGMMSNPTVGTAVAELDRSEVACAELKTAAERRAREAKRQEEMRKRAEATAAPAERPKQPEPVVTEVCGRTLDDLDKVLGNEETMCAENNSTEREGGSPRFARLVRDCERGPAIDWKSSWPFVHRRVLDMVDTLERTHAYCQQTDPAYRRRINQRPE